MGVLASWRGGGSAGYSTAEVPLHVGWSMLEVDSRDHGFRLNSNHGPAATAATIEVLQQTIAPAASKQWEGSGVRFSLAFGHQQLVEAKFEGEMN